MWILVSLRVPMMEDDGTIALRDSKLYKSKRIKGLKKWIQNLDASQSDTSINSK